MDLSAFKAYDIRGRVPDQLNKQMAENIGRAYVEVTGARKVIVGRDIRLSSPELAGALIEGLLAAGADVYDIGLGGTEHVYFATFHYQMDGGIVVTASHNPKDYNGMKLVTKGSRPLSSDNGLLDIKARVAESFVDASSRGTHHELNIAEDYIEHLLGYVDIAKLKPLKIVVNAGNGGAGLVVDQLEKHLPFGFVKLHHQPDGQFPHGVPNPLLPENRDATREAVIREQADMGIAWDGDFDRCFFFDGNGRFIEGYYVVGLLAELFLRKQPGAKIIYDPRLTWNTEDIVSKLGGVAVQSKTGHAFIKQIMRDVDAVYGGEMSAHHYFRDFAYCDSGMIPWLMVAELLSISGQSLAELIDERIRCYPASGEINRRLDAPAKVLEAIETEYKKGSESVSYVDGLSIEYEDWRFNLRMSNTEPLVRLNVETRGDEALMRSKTEALLARIDAI